MVEVNREPRLRGALATALEQRRERYNAAFAQARHARPKLDGEAFGGFLCDRVAPIVEAVAAVNPATVPLVAEVLYDVSLEMMGTDMQRRPEIEAVWRDLLPAAGHLLGAAPRRLVASLCNAAVQMKSDRHADTARWLAWMQAACPSARSIDTLLTVGQALAWRCGLAHYREGALAALVALPTELAGWVLEVAPNELPTRLQAMRDDRWLSPATAPTGEPSLRLVARCGGFRGFGELFSRPPTISVADDQLFVTDGDDTWQLTADVFGATFHPTQPPPSGTGGGALRLEADGTVWWGRESRRMAVLAGARSWASTSDTLAVTVPTSHFVYLVARTRG